MIHGNCPIFYVMNVIICLQIQHPIFMKWWNVAYFLQPETMLKMGKKKNCSYFLKISNSTSLSNCNVSKHRTEVIAIELRLFSDDIV